MQTKPYFNRLTMFSLLLISIGFDSQSCNKVNEVLPLNPTPYRVTVKITNLNSAASVSSLNFRITSDCTSKPAILDTTISGNCTYSFNCQPGTTIKAALSSVSSFNSSIEIDVNGRQTAYHSGSCPGNEYDLSDYIGD